MLRSHARIYPHINKELENIVLDLSMQTKAWMQDDKQLSERLKCKPHKFELKINKGQKIKKCAKCGMTEVEPIISRK